MPIMHMLLPFLLVPICSELNHLGGQSTTIPDPRILCRVFGIGAAFAFIASLLIHDEDTIFRYWLICTAGMAFWAVFKWGPMFMALDKPPGEIQDNRYYGSKWYVPDYWITKLCDLDMGVSPLKKLTTDQCREWGTIYGTYRGLMMYPMFIAMAFYITPWAILVGFFSLAQGVVYRSCTTVLRAEYFFGAMIGLALAAVLILHLA